jgi:hypothetical protein
MLSTALHRLRTGSHTGIGAKATPKTQGYGACCPQPELRKVDVWPKCSPRAQRRIPPLGSGGAGGSTGRRCVRSIVGRSSAPAGEPHLSFVRTTSGWIRGNLSTSSRSGWPRQNVMEPSSAPQRGRNRAHGHGSSGRPTRPLTISFVPRRTSRRPEQGVREIVSETSTIRSP